MTTKYDNLNAVEKKALRDLLLSADENKNQILELRELPKIVQYLADMQRAIKPEQIKCSALLSAKDLADRSPLAKLPPPAQMLADRALDELLSSALTKSIYAEKVEADAVSLAPLSAVFALQLERCVKKQR